MIMKPLLAFDCAGLRASVALLAHGMLHERVIEQGNQAVELVPVMDTLLRESRIDYADLGHIITTIGPGSFTGVRIGLATLHGLALATGVPIKTLTSLQAMAWEVLRGANAPSDLPPQFMVALRAGKGEVYAQSFTIQNHQPHASGEIFLAPETTTDWAWPCFGNIADAASPQFIAAANAATLCKIAEHIDETPLSEALPCYVRAPDANIPSSPAWLS